MLTKTWNKTQWAGFAGPGVAALIFVLSAIACAAPGAAPLDLPTTAPSDTPTPSPIPTSTPTATPTATATATSTPTPTLTPTPTPSPTITPTPTPKVLLTDTFDGNDNDWTIGKGEASDAEIVDGSMVVTVSRGSWSRYVEPDLSNPDVDMTVETTLIANSSQETDLGYGLVCRSGRSGVNTFELSPDGRYAIWHSVKKDWIMLANGRDPTIVLPPPATNTIRAICAGDRLTLIVNGKLLAVVLDKDLTSGFAGFVVGTGKNTPRVAVKFDNLVIRQPDSGSITRLDVSIGARPEERP